MDHLTPPTASLHNLTIADTPSLPTNALENLTISGTNSEKNKPRKLVMHIKPSRKQPRIESFRHAHLIALTRQWYGPQKASPSPICLEDPSHRPSDVVSEEERMNRLRLHASKPWLDRESINSVRLSCIRRRIIGELSNLAENKPEHREKLELAKSYVQQRENREEVLSIINSVYTNY